MERLDKFRRQMVEANIDAFFINSPENRRYLSGFTGSHGFLLLKASESYLLTDFRYIEQATEQASSFKVLNIGHEPYQELNRLGGEIKRLGFEGDVLPYKEYEKLKGAFPSVELVSAPEIPASLRAIKDETEIEKIRQAVKIADSAFLEIIKTIEEGQSEAEISLTIEYLMRKSGASGRSFDFIVASGLRSALPHGVATTKTVKSGEFITMDFGAIYDGYCSDITRTIFLGEPEEKHRDIYEIVLQAQQLGIDAIAPGLTGQEVDHQARDFIKKAGYGDYFGHGLGHSIGLAIHEGPNLNTREERVLKPGMVVTVEPGIYIPNWGGVRIEDVVLVTETGCEVLTKAPKELFIL